VDIKLAIVNSKSFGKYTNAIEELEKICKVSIMEIHKGVEGTTLAETFEGIHFIIATSYPRYDRFFFKNNKSVVSILIHGISTDNIDLKAATEEGVVIVKVPGPVEREAVAELTIGLIIDALRHVTMASNKVREGKWSERGKYVGSEITSKVVGIVGVGNIGSRVAEILIKGFKAKVLAYDPYISAEKIKRMGLQPVTFDELLQKSDIITIHCALTEETYHMFNENSFKKLKDGVIIINTARGAIIDTNALIKALEEKKVSAVGLDVIEGEPIEASHPLLRFDNVIITPHIGAYTLEALRGMDRTIVDSVKSLLKKEIPENIVNKEVINNPRLRLKSLLI
jgi:D-3-phosphoglycerate dehydrogenase